MKSKWWILTLILIILIIPTRKVANDGGTIVYSTAFYKVIKWNRIRSYEENKTGTEVYWFPTNFHSLDYYDSPRPEAIAICSGEKFVVANTGAYQWSKKVDGTTLYVNACGIGPLDMEYKENLKVVQSNNVKTYLPGKVTEIKTFQINGDNVGLIDNKLNYNEESQELNVGVLDEGVYIIELLVEDGNNKVRYSFKLEMHDSTEDNKK